MICHRRVAGVLVGVLVCVLMLAAGCHRSSRERKAGKPARARAGAYKVVMVPPLPGHAGNVALDVNNSGKVVGWSQAPGNASQHAYLFDARTGAMTDLGTLGGTHSAANAISADDVVVGWSTVPGRTWHTRAFAYRKGVMWDIGGFTRGQSWATAIDDAETVVGAYELPGGRAQRGFRYLRGVATDLGAMLPGNQSQALGITPNGKTIVGYAGPAANDAWRATLHTGSGWTDLGTLGGASATAGAINRNGVVAGGSMLANDATTHAFTKPVGGQMKDLGTLGGGVSYAHAINASGQTVGSSSVAGAGQKRAFLHDGNVMHDLATLVSNPQGWVFVEAKGINDQGWIVGSGTYNGQTRGFVLIP